MKISNIPIIGKFLVIMSFFGLLSVGSTIFSSTKMQGIDDGYSYAMDHQGITAVYLAKANRALSGIRAAVSGLEIANTEELDAASEADIKDTVEQFVKNTDKAKAADISNTYHVAEFKTAALDVIENVCAKAIKLGRSASTPEAVLASQAEFMKVCDPPLKALVNDGRKIVDVAVGDEKKANDDLTAVTTSTIHITYAVVLGGLALVAAMAWFALRAWISTPIAAMTTTMLRLADGDLSTTVEGADRRDEIGRMSKAVQVFKDNGLKLKASEASSLAARQQADAERERAQAVQAEAAHQQQHVVEAIGQGLEQLSDGSLVFRLDEAFAAEYEKLRTDFNGAMAKLQDTMKIVSGNTVAIQSGTTEISTAADDLSRRTEQQAASLEETAAALDEITATVRKTAEGSNHARDVVGAAKKDAEHSGQVVTQAVEAMTGIEKSSNQIGQIIGVIDEIAFQTNLLALNAGVEAARAGDAGRGFAVVASEVRALAQRSAEAAKEIKTLISASRVQVEQGVALVGETGKGLERIQLQISEINGIVNDIAGAAQEQAAGLDEVNTAVNQMDQVTQQNAAMVEESTAASHALARETQELARLIGRFKLGQIAGGGRPAPKVAGRSAAPVKSAAALRTVGSGQAVRKSEPANDWQDF